MSEQKRRPGRPATGKTPLMSVRVPRAIQDAARARAKQLGRPFATEVARLLAEYANGSDNKQ